MNVLIIGGVDAGTITAAKLNGENRDTEVTIISKGNEFSLAGGGRP